MEEWDFWIPGKVLALIPWKEIRSAQVEEDILLRDLVPPRGGQARGTVDPPFQINEAQLQLAVEAALFKAFRPAGVSSLQFVPPPAPPPPPPLKTNELNDTIYHIAKFVKLMPTLFEGGPDPLVADSFMDRVEKHINAMNLATNILKITLAIYNFVGDAEIWWKTVSHTHNLDTMTYDTFKKLYYEKYFPAPKQRELKKEFDGLKQGNMTVTEYENKFTSFLRFARGIANNEEGNIEKFVDGLNLTIRPIVAASEPTEYAKAVRKALVVEAESRDSKAIKEFYKHNRGMSAFSEGQSSKKQKHEQSGFRGQQPVRSSPTASVSTGSSISNASSSQGQRTQGRVFALTLAESPSSPSVVRGIFLVSHSWARVLFDFGASYSFIASSFTRVLGLEVSQLDRSLCVDTPIGDSVTIGRVCRSCSITIAGRVIEFDFILLEMTGFDVILGMDWLSSFRAVIDCFRGRVSMCTPDRDCFCFVEDQCDSLTSSFYGTRGWDRQTFFLASLFADDDVEFCGVDYPEVVRDFLDVFSEDLIELPPHREMQFAIDLMPSNAPISMAPCKIVRFTDLVTNVYAVIGVFIV
ncbi:uncharacterized protein LOC132309782 [Cornus florida]|uniref:uncharacterized protein LOC132309782 n=1 Tax=Cornus florida TaxID=4283 RepID=UPI002897E4B4|nr:uncharacterized protein LOC132309782 [Cornus florida]